ncbi:MAG TPA: hypothetical protein DCL44_00095 [Elusimicrobia bacterium]|nr:hypothetical protein [Elusimicrobiota bacterium]
MEKDYNFLLLCASTIVFGGCVPLDEASLPKAQASRAMQAPYKELYPGYKSNESLHFVVKAYSSETTQRYSSLCEEDYQRIMVDLGIYSFVPSKPYNIVIYGDAAEYHLKTSQPAWSGGITYGNAILIYDFEGSPGILAHEMTHLVFNEFMGLSAPESLRWLNEGIAVYEQMRADYPSKASYEGKIASDISLNPIPFSQMMNLVPRGENDAMVERWYAQAGSVASFMLRQGGSLNFSYFLGRLKDGQGLDEAAAASFGGLWKDMKDVERTWLLEIKR